MSLRHRKLYYSIGSILLLACLVSGIGLAIWYQKTTSCYNGNTPLKSFTANIDATQQAQLIEEFRKFGTKNGFKFHIAYYTPNHKQFLIELTRKDIEVIASDPFDSGEFIVGFYNHDCIHLTAVSEIGGLVSELKDFISEVPNVMITEEK